MSDKEFVDGLLLKHRKEQAPDFIKMHISIKREELITWLQNKEDEWVNLDVKESKKGHLYAEVDNWKPDPNRGKARPAQQATSDDIPYDDDIPF